MSTSITAPEPIEIQFDPDQEFQQDAIRAVVDLFKGQTIAPTEFEVAERGQLNGTLFTVQGVGNNLILADEQIVQNLAEVQDRNDIPEGQRGLADSAITLSSRDFTVEMETGTGKTYVYLRTAVELNQEYGFTKFVIVVPSVAIRENVEQSLTQLQEHFAALYDGIQYGVIKYHSEDLSRLRGFATSNTMQILVINIDAFNKTSNRINLTQDAMMGEKPIDFIRSCNPIVILDEPQNMESDKAKEALADLNPVVTLRYSATHRNHYHQVYRLTPADACNLGLVKRISVWSVTEELNGNLPYIKVVKVTPSKTTVKATVEVSVRTAMETKRKKIIVTGGANATDLRQVTDLDMYDGFVVEEIDAEHDRVEFTNGVIVRAGEVTGASRDEVQRAQIRTTIEEHLDRELDFHQRRVDDQSFPRMKVLSLFFIDKVDNYAPAEGKFRTWFEAEYADLADKPKYANLDLPDVGEAHGGYFSQDRKGAATDTTGKTKADDAAYEKIMRNKQLLASPDEPLRFIFSHSALREGWDSPNVFNICTLNDSKSEVKKRQEVGRGMRLPFGADGQRYADRDVAVLTIIANQAYEEFAANLQSEIESETNSSYSRDNIDNGREKPEDIPLNDEWDRAEFADLWDKIKHRTTYRVRFDTPELIAKAAERLAKMPSLVGARILVQKANIDHTETGIEALQVREKAAKQVANSYPIPDLLGILSRSIPVSRSTIAQVLITSARLGEVSTNPQQFIEQVKTAIEGTLNDLLVSGIEYTKRGDGSDATYDLSLFEEHTLRAKPSRSYEVTNPDRSPYKRVVWDSVNPESEIARTLDTRDGIKTFVKLPAWFKVETPLGNYNPDWAYIKEDDTGTDRLYLVRESKPTRDLSKLRANERLKIEFGEQHFKVLAPVEFGVIDDAAQI